MALAMETTVWQAVSATEICDVEKTSARSLPYLWTQRRNALMQKCKDGKEENDIQGAHKSANDMSAI